MFPLLRLAKIPSRLALLSPPSSLPLSLGVNSEVTLEPKIDKQEIIFLETPKAVRRSVAAVQNVCSERRTAAAPTIYLSCIDTTTLLLT